MLQGHLPHRTDLSRALGPTSTPGYVAAPSLAQRMHCLVMCIAAPSATDPTCTSRIRELKQIATSRGAPPPTPPRWATQMGYSNGPVRWAST